MFSSGGVGSSASSDAAITKLHQLMITEATTRGHA
jgi:hypothetical protein